MTRQVTATRLWKKMEPGSLSTHRPQRYWKARNSVLQAMSEEKDLSWVFQTGCQKAAAAAAEMNHPSPVAAAGQPQVGAGAAKNIFCSELTLIFTNCF
jgi:hypothetical protein